MGLSGKRSVFLSTNNVHSLQNENWVKINYFIILLVGILSIMCRTSSSTQDAVDIEMQCDMLFILSTLCEGDMHRKVIM